MIFFTKPFTFSKDTIAVRRLSFYNLSPDKLRQHFEITKDNGKSGLRNMIWNTGERNKIEQWLIFLEYFPVLPRR